MRRTSQRLQDALRENEVQRRVCAFLVHQAARLAHDLLPNVPNPKAKQTLRDLTTGLEGIESALGI
jgi:hypothetical protein